MNTLNKPLDATNNRPRFDSTGFSQLDDIRIAVLTISRYCRDVLAGDTAKFDAVANGWRKVTDSLYPKNEVLAFPA